MKPERLAIRQPDFRGAIRKAWRWSTFRWEWGRWCYITNCHGDTLAQWWEWEVDA